MITTFAWVALDMSILLFGSAARTIAKGAGCSAWNVGLWPSHASGATLRIRVAGGGGTLIMETKRVPQQCFVCGLFGVRRLRPCSAPASGHNRPNATET